MKPVRQATIPAGAWPRRMGAELAAGYCGEPTAEAFIKRWRRGEYPPPAVKERGRVLWLIDDLDRTIAPQGSEAVQDVVRDL